MDLKTLKDEIDKLPAPQKAEALALLLALEDERQRETAKSSFLTFVQRMWPDFIMGQHHKIMADAFERLASGKSRRIIINMAPRHTKSEFGSYLFPAWFLGQYPDKKIIQASHTAELAVSFGRKVRNLINSQPYQDVFEGVRIAQDSKAAGRWNTNRGGTYYAVGVGGAMTGIGADVLVIDDPHNEQEAALAIGNPAIYDKTYEWFTSGPRQRLQPGGGMLIIQTRWAKRDLTGQLVQNSIKGAGADQWEVIELPAIMPSGNPLWPEFWTLDELQRIKASIPISKWNAQYQQQPTAEEGALIKREWWKRWDRNRPPQVEAVIQSWDTAFAKTERANYSACTTWGVFMHPDSNGKDQPNIILLHAYKEKLEFPELKKMVRHLYSEWEPDQLVVEKRASGAALVYELRAMGIPLTEFTPSRGNDKIARVNAITDIFSSGYVWAPMTSWADEVIEECASFPFGENDDYVDSTSQALLRYRKGGWIRTDMDEEPPEEYPREPIEYY